MRSNGAAHIGNDTFVLATRDDDAHLFLFTSAFPADEQRAEVKLERRVRLTPKSTLLSDAATLKQYLDDLAKRAEERDSRVLNGDDSLVPSGAAAAASASQPARRVGSVGSGVSFKRAQGPDPDLVVSSASSSAGDSDDDADARDGPDAAVRRHALFASPDGQQVIAISNQPRHHYIFDVGRNGHDMVCEFETDSLVRSVCWHTEKARILFLLLATGEVVVYDTAYARFGVVYPHALRLDPVPMLRRFVREDVAGASTLAVAAAASASVSSASSVAQPKLIEQGTNHKPVVTPPPDQRSAARFPLPLNAYGQPDHTYAWNAPRRQIDAPQSGTTAAALLTLGARPGRAAVERDAADVHLHEDVRTTMSMHLSSLLRPPTVRKDRDLVKSAHEEADLSQQQDDDVDEDGDSALHGHQPTASTTLFQPEPFYGRDILALAAAEDGDDGKAAGARRTTTTSAPQPPPSSGALVVVHQKGSEAQSQKPLSLTLRHERDRPTCPFDLVDMCVVPASRSRPVVLLLLSSSGDVFSLRIDDDCLPKRAEATLPDGKLCVRDEDIKRAAEQARRTGSPIVHHLISAPTRTTDEQALRLTATVLDDDDGLCAVVTCWSSGALRGVFVDEPDLIARDVASTGSRASAHRGGFTVQLGAALPVASLLSPAIASTSHLVHMEKQNNLLLVRYGHDDGAVYLIALPVWDRTRLGWNYWCPRCCDAGERRRESLRLPVARPADNGVPAPLSLRIPYDATGASVALGVRELVIAPEIAQYGGPPGLGDNKKHTKSSAVVCPRDFTVVADIASLLKSALIARSAGWSLGTAAADGSKRAAAASEPVTALLETVAECHRSHLCAQPHAVVSAQLDKIGTGLEHLIGQVQDEEKKVTEREAAVRDRVAALTRKVHEDVDAVAAWQKTLLDAMVHRRGVESLVTSNDRLGEVHRMLNEYDKILEAQQQQQQQTANSKSKGGPQE